MVFCYFFGNFLKNCFNLFFAYSVTTTDPSENESQCVWLTVYLCAEYIQWRWRDSDSDSDDDGDGDGDDWLQWQTKTIIRKLLQHTN